MFYTQELPTAKMTAAQAMERRNQNRAATQSTGNYNQIVGRFQREVKTMNYSELKEVMHNFRTGNATRAEMVAAFALWQRPVDTSSNKKAAIEAVIR